MTIVPPIRKILVPVLLAALSAACGSGDATGEKEPGPARPSGGGQEAGEVPPDIFTDTSNPEEVYRRGLSLYQDGQFNESAMAFLQATRMWEGFIDAHYYAGKSLLKSFPTDLLGAEVQFRRVMELSPDHLDAHIALAQAYDFWGRSADAAALLANARRLSPDHRGVLYASGLVASRLGRHEEAISFLQGALARDPRHLPSILELAQALSHLGRDQKALETYMKAVTLQPGNAQALMGAGTSLKRLGRDNEARQMLARFKMAQSRQEGRDMHGKRVDVRLRAIQEAYQAKDLEGARVAAEKFRQEFRGAVSAQIDLAALQSQLGDLDAALRTYQGVLRLQPKNLTATHRLSVLHRRRGEEDKAREMRARYDELKAEYDETARKARSRKSK